MTDNISPRTVVSLARKFKLPTILKYLAVFSVVWGARLWLIQFYSSPVPFWDQWDEAINFLKPWLEGTLSWQTWFEPHNEHRIVFTRILDVGLLSLNRQWDPQLQMVVNAFIVGILACVLIYCARSLEIAQRTVVATLPPLSARHLQR